MNDETRAASLEESFNRKVRSGGRVFVNQLAILVKVAQMHDLKNEAVQNAAESLAGTLGSFFQDRKNFSLTLIGDYLFIEDIRVKYNVEDFNNFDYLVQEFKKRKLGAINFNPVVDAKELIVFVDIFLTAELGRDEVYQDMVRRLGLANVSGLATEELRPPKAYEGFQRISDVVNAASRAYVRVVLKVGELFEGMEKGQPADIRKLKRAVQTLVDSIYRGEQALIRLASIRRSEQMLERHYANVCVLSLCIGKRLGLSRYQMARLGMAALLHDVGRQAIAGKLSAGEELGDEDVELIKGHPRLGVETILRLKGLNEVAVSAMIVAYEHHRNVDGTGYPEQLEAKEMSLFSRIVRIADNYDATTSAGVYGKVPLPPDKAIELMAGRSGSYYDPELLKTFVRLMGLYPVGTFLLLEDGSAGVVAAPGQGIEGGSRPAVILVDNHGAAGEVVELTAKDENGKYRRGIARSLNPQQYGINISKYLV